MKWQENVSRCPTVIIKHCIVLTLEYCSLSTISSLVRGMRPARVMTFTRQSTTNRCGLTNSMRYELVMKNSGVVDEMDPINSYIHIIHNES